MLRGAAAKLGVGSMRSPEGARKAGTGARQRRPVRSQAQAQAPELGLVLELALELLPQLLGLKLELYQLLMPLLLEETRLPRNRRPLNLRRICARAAPALHQICARSIAARSVATFPCGLRMNTPPLTFGRMPKENRQLIS